MTSGAWCDGVDAVSEVPADRWDVDADHDPDPAAPNKMVTRRAGFVQVDLLDAVLRHFAARSQNRWTRSSGCCWRPPMSFSRALGWRSSNSSRYRHWRLRRHHDQRLRPPDAGRRITKFRRLFGHWWRVEC